MAACTGPAAPGCSQWKNAEQLPDPEGEVRLQEPHRRGETSSGAEESCCRCGRCSGHFGRRSASGGGFLLVFRAVGDGDVSPVRASECPEQMQ
ncbi:unnamed protein product [Pleuronectes platessa]|uniref:Uncharacterized protein n=1 Tax=Pleuronectes platessa TaxID=8262 RepID=A0A9N7YDS3_PLEPL|nr:unnamed protein product [Pleuronectes platessa]